MEQQQEKFLKVGLREKRADLSFPVSPTRGRIRCGTIWLLAWMGIFQNFTFQKVKPNRTQVSSFWRGREIQPYYLVQCSMLADILLDCWTIRLYADDLHLFSRCHLPLFYSLRQRRLDTLCHYFSSVILSLLRYNVHSLFKSERTVT